MLGASARYTHPDDLHLTLQFLGDQPRAGLLADWQRASQRLRPAASAQIEFQRLQVWPSADAQLVVAVFKPSRRLLRWRAALALVDPVVRDPRPFVAHVTLLRARVLGELPAFKLAPFVLPVRRLALFCRAAPEASMTAGSARYQRLAELALDATLPAARAPD